MPDKPTCSIPECPKPVAQNGWCGMHYQRWYRRGNPGLAQVERFRMQPEAKFWNSVERTTTCWLWRAGKDTGGYGVITVQRRKTKAHRFAYELLVGPIPKGLQIDHLCRVRNCVNPAHLEPVSQRENVLRGIAPPARQARQTHCKRGHEFTSENTMTEAKSGKRHCRACRELPEYREKQREAELRRTSRNRKGAHESAAVFINRTGPFQSG